MYPDKKVICDWKRDRVKLSSNLIVHSLNNRLPATWCFWDWGGYTASHLKLIYIVKYCHNIGKWCSPIARDLRGVVHGTSWGSQTRIEQIGLKQNGRHLQTTILLTGKLIFSLNCYWLRCFVSISTKNSYFCLFLSMQLCLFCVS